MRRRTYMIGAAAVGLLGAALGLEPSYGRVVHTARDFHEYFRSLDSAKAGLSPVERLVFSLMLTNTVDECKTGDAAVRRAS